MSHFLLGGRANISCPLKDSESLRDHLSSQPESCHLGSKPGQKSPQPLHSVFLPTLGSTPPSYLQFQNQCQLSSLGYFSLHTTKFLGEYMQLRQRKFLCTAHLPSTLEWAMALVFSCSSPLTLLRPDPKLLSENRSFGTQQPSLLEAASVPAAHTRGWIRQSCAVKHTHARLTCAFHSRNTWCLNHFYASLGLKQYEWLCARGSVCWKMWTFSKVLYLRKS